MGTQALTWVLLKKKMAFTPDSKVGMWGGPPLGGPVPGAASGDRPADDHIRGILAELNFTMFGPLTPISYTKQIVAGTNYVIKASAPGGVTVTLHAFKPLGGAPARVTRSSAVC